MTKATLRAALIADTHRDYGAAETDRFIAQGEALLRAKLKGYSLEYTFSDTDRSGPTSSIYTLPSGVMVIRHLIDSSGCPLLQLDESGAAQKRSITIGYCVRPKTILIVATPAAVTTFLMTYLGMPPALAVDGDTNKLLEDYPQVYQEAASIYIYKRAQDYESASIAQTSFNTLVSAINTKIRVLLGSAQASNAYNTSFRSSY